MQRRGCPPGLKVRSQVMKSPPPNWHSGTTTCSSSLPPPSHLHPRPTIHPPHTPYASPPQVLLLESDSRVQKELEAQLSACSYAVTSYSSSQEAAAGLADPCLSFELLVVDVKCVTHSNADVLAILKVGVEAGCRPPCMGHITH